MLVTYISLTGNVRRFVRKLDMDSFEIKPSNVETKVNDSFIVIVPTYDEEVNSLIYNFIDYEDNLERLVGFVGSGNLNFNEDYVWAAKKLAAHYNKPLLLTFEFSGTDDDVQNLKKEVIHLESTGAE